MFREASGTDLICQALVKAAGRNQFPPELIHHSDRGVQYASFRYRQLLKSMGIRQSMRRRGNCYDNAMTESFIHASKVELVHTKDYASFEVANNDIGDYIENFYNSQRRHSSLSYKSPAAFLAQWTLAA